MCACGVGLFGEVVVVGGANALPCTYAWGVAAQGREPQEPCAHPAQERVDWHSVSDRTFRSAFRSAFRSGERGDELIYQCVAKRWYSTYT